MVINPSERGIVTIYIYILYYIIANTHYKNEIYLKLAI